MALRQNKKIPNFSGLGIFALPFLTGKPFLTQSTQRSRRKKAVTE
jgi:hypothetical protein